MVRSLASFCGKLAISAELDKTLQIAASDQIYVTCMMFICLICCSLCFF